MSEKKCITPTNEERLQKIDMLQSQNDHLVEGLVCLIKQIEINDIDIKFQINELKKAGGDEI